MTCQISGRVVLIYDGTTWRVFAYVSNGGTVVTLDAIQTLTNKTLTAPSISDPTITGELDAQGGVREAWEWNATPGSAKTIDFSRSLVQLTLTENITITLEPASAGQTLTLRLDNPSGYTVTWALTGGGIKWPGGSAPAMDGANYEYFWFISSSTTNAQGRSIVARSRPV